MSADRDALPVTVASHPGLWRAGPRGPALPSRLSWRPEAEAPLNLLKGVATELGRIQRQP